MVLTEKGQRIHALHWWSLWNRHEWTQRDRSMLPNWCKALYMHKPSQTLIDAAPHSWGLLAEWEGGQVTPYRQSIGSQACPMPKLWSVLFRANSVRTTCLRRKNVPLTDSESIARLTANHLRQASSVLSYKGRQSNLNQWELFGHWNLDRFKETSHMVRKGTVWRKHK